MPDSLIWCLTLFELTVIVGATIVVLAFILFFLALAKAASSKLLSPPRLKRSWTPKDLGHEFENVSLKVRNGLLLKGWFIDKGSASTVLAIHGYTASKWEEYMKLAINILAKNGFNIAAFDFRAHGESEGVITTLGVEEVEDYREIISWLKSEKKDRAKKIGVIGYSMGGAVTIMLAAKDARVNAVVADSPYINILTSGKRWIMRLKGALRTSLLIAYPLIVKFSASKAGIRVEDLTMYKYAGKIKIPFMIIAGSKDDLVPLSEIKKFFEGVKESNPVAELWVTEGGHVQSIKNYPKEYEEKLINFFRKYLR